MQKLRHKQYSNVALSLCMCLIMAMGGRAWAQPTEQPGDESPSGAITQASAAQFNEEDEERTAAQIAQQESLFAQSIVDIESDWGPYDARLVEALLSAGRYSLEIGRFSDAAERFSRALNVSRVSNGLLNPDQIQILELLVESLSGAGQWKDADDRVHLAFYLQRKLLDKKSEEYARAVLEYGDWKLAGIYNANFRLNDRRELTELEVIYNELLSGDEASRRDTLDAASLLRVQQSPWSSQTKIELLHQIALTHYSVVAINMDSLPTYLVYPEPQYVYQTVCNMVTLQDGNVSRVCGRQRVQNSAYWQQQNERWRFKQEMVDRTRELAVVIESMSSMVANEPELVLSDSVDAAARIEEMKAMQLQLEKSMSFIRMW